jgi:nicotinamide riboside kinase
MQTKSDLYFVMNDEIPFEEDKLRYGGNKRETDKQFWIDLLEEYGCNYYVVKSVYMSNQILEIEREIEKFLNNKFEKISSFMRD